MNDLSGEVAERGRHKYSSSNGLTSLKKVPWFVDTSLKETQHPAEQS